MRLQEGPAFGALIIGAGFTYFIHRQTQNIFLAAGAGVGIAGLDYFFLIWINNFKNKK